MRIRGKAGSGGGASSGVDAMALADELVARSARIEADLASAEAAEAATGSSAHVLNVIARHVEAALKAGDDAECCAKESRSRALVKQDRDKRAASPARCASAHKGRGGGASPGHAASPGKAAFGSSCPTARQLTLSEAQ